MATLAVRARDYETAAALFAEVGDDDAERSWPDLLDRAEAALGAGDHEGAVELAEVAVGQFEEQFARLRRDADRVMASDDIKVAALYRPQPAPSSRVPTLARRAVTERRKRRRASARLRSATGARTCARSAARRCAR